MNNRTLRRFLWLCVAIVGGGSSGLLAQGPSPTLADLPGSSISSVFRVLAAFALVLTLFGAVVWGLKNWQRLVVHKGLPLKLRVLESKPLGQRHALYVVGYEEQRLLIAASPAGVTFLSRLPPGTPREEAAPEMAPAMSWSAVLAAIAQPYRH